ncbi:hypothetical protein FRC11_001358 [Ceratobasidium sp. 423]|nr:hypothetical protein FRC11_001358 [Ceratobasidium sp. 423]
MGFLTDNEFEFEDEQDPITPPQSPRLAATHAQVIAEQVTNTSSELNNTVARDYAALCCEEFGLTDLDKDDVLRVSQMNAQLIAIRQYTRVVALTQNITQSLTESFLLSTEFKDHVTRRIQATFLDPTIPTYVRGSTARLIQHMQENAASWRIPRVVQAHFVNSRAFRKAVAAVASNFRGDMRRKLKKSMVDNLDIGALANKLCVKGYQPSNEHWRRYALLRCYMADWEKLPCQAGRGRAISFWAYIDTKLDKLRINCTKPTAAATAAAIKNLLKTNLKNDQKKYTGPTSGRTKLPVRPQIPEWQRDHGKAVADMLEYTIEAHPDEDVDEDDTGDAPDGSEPQAPTSHETDMSEARQGAGDTGNNVPRGPDSETQQTDTTGASVEPQVGHSHAPRPRVLVPETQESASLGGTQQGWAGGSLVDRHRRPMHTSSSPTSRPSSASTSQHRPN